MKVINGNKPDNMEKTEKEQSKFITNESKYWNVSVLVNLHQDGNTSLDRKCF